MGVGETQTLAARVGYWVPQASWSQATWVPGKEESLRTMLLLLISKFILSDYKTEQGIQVESPVAPLFPLGVQLGTQLP